MADSGGWNFVLLLRLRQYRTESLVQGQMALLLGNISAACRRLPHQHIPEGCGRCLRQPVHAINRAVERWQLQAWSETGNQVPVRQQDRDSGIGVAGEGIYDLRSHTGLGGARPGAE